MTIQFNAKVDCQYCPIRHRAVCARCDDNELSQLNDIKTYKSFEAGEPIVWRGEPLQFVASVVAGVASLSKSLEDGRTQLVGLLLPSDFIGRPGRREIEFDVTATTDVTLCCFEYHAFEKLVNQTPNLSKRLMELALDELDAAREWMLLLGRKTAREKVATFVEMLVRRSNVDDIEGNRPALSLPLTREQMANYLGLTLETVSRQLNALKKEGILEFNDRRSFAVTDLSKLHLETGDDADGGIIS
jgi:CRP/FNR family transcriptional regulator